MRSYNNVNSETTLYGQLTLSITGADSQNTWEFDHADIRHIDPIRWEIPFGGGLGKPSTYRVSLSTSLGFINANINQIPKAEVRLSVNINDEIKQVHVGRVRQLSRLGDDPNLLGLTVYDAFLDANPKFPVASIVDSYSSVHPEVYEEDWGYPVYYGKHTRPFYHTAVDCDIDQLIAPINISSANHVNSVFFCSDLDLGPDTSQEHNLLFNKEWDYTTNVLSGGKPFEIIDADPLNSRFWAYDGFLRNDNSIVINSQGNLGIVNHGYSVALAIVDNTDDANFSAPVSTRISQEIEELTRINFYSNFSNVTVTNHFLKIGVTSGSGINRYTVTNSNQGTLVGSFDLSGTAGADLFGEGKNGFIEFDIEGSTTGTVTHTASISLGASLKSTGYKNYSIFSPQVNCTEIAFSENPIQILEDIFDQNGIPFLQSQASDTQVDVQSYHFQCFFGERERVSNIIDQFGKITATYFWLGDSGTINMRTFTESADATIDAVITTSDMVSFSLIENPLGVSRFEAKKAKRIQVAYDYEFQKDTFEKVVAADKNNNSLCDSAESSGIDLDTIEQTRYIKEADTASYYLGNLVRKSTQNETYVNMILPMRYVGLELADILNIRHPMLVNSDNLFQVVNVDHEYIKKRIKISAAKLLTLSA